MAKATAKKKKPTTKKVAKKTAPKKTVKKVAKKKAVGTKSATKKKTTRTATAKKPAKKAAASTRKSVKKTTVSTKKKVTPKKKAPVTKKTAPKTKAVKTTTKKTAPSKKATPSVPKKTSAKAKAISLSMDKSTKKVSLRKGVLSRKSSSKPIAFSMDEVQSIAKTVSKSSAKEKKAAEKNSKKAAPAKKIITEPIEPAKPSHVAAASLADILGFAPGKSNQSSTSDEKNVPSKFKRYYKLLIALREHLTAGIELHSEETLKRSAKDDAGDLSSYGQHMADAGTDTFDRDFALSLVSSEQEALSEIEAAIKRIHDGTYGVCEITGKAIAKDRLVAVPFTRYSAEAQKDLERNRHRARSQAGLFGEHGEEASKLMDVDGDGD